MYGAHKGDWSMVDPEAWVYLNAKGSGGIMWDDLPSTFDELKEAFATIPALQPVADSKRKLVAVLHLGNLTLAGKGDEDAAFTKDTTKHVAACAKLLGVPASPQAARPRRCSRRRFSRRTSRRASTGSPSRTPRTTPSL